MKILETTLPQNYSKGLFEEKNYDLAAEHTDKIAYILFTAVSNLLNGSKSKDRPVSFELNEVDGKVIAAAIVQYFPNEDDSKPGNWNLVWTFDEADIPENANRISITNPNSHSYFRSVAGDKYGIRFKDPTCLTTMLTYLVSQIRKWLDENAKEGEEVSVEQDAVFQARVAIEGGQKVFSLEPAGEIKMLIKDDASIEK